MDDRFESQAQTLNNPERTRIFLQTFKTVKCNNPECVFRVDIDIDPSPFQEITQCSFFHDESDQRRQPYVPTNPLALQYSQFPRDCDPNGCLNDMEYLFHPLNYHQFQCVNHRPNRKTDCLSKYCPYYHQITEKIDMKIINQSVAKKDIFSEIKSSLSEADAHVAKFLKMVKEDQEQKKNVFALAFKAKKQKVVQPQKQLETTPGRQTLDS